jgi:hypothetical protein
MAAIYVPIRHPNQDHYLASKDMAQYHCRHNPNRVVSYIVTRQSSAIPSAYFSQQTTDSEQTEPTNMPYKINYKQTFPFDFERTSHGALWRQIIEEFNHHTSPRPLYRPLEDSRTLPGHVANRLHTCRYGHYDGHHERQVFGLLIDYYELWKTPLIASGILDEIAHATRSASKDGMNLHQLKTLEAVLGGWLEDCETVMGWDDDTMYVHGACFWTLEKRIIHYKGSRYGNYDEYRILKEED